MAKRKKAVEKPCQQCCTMKAKIEASMKRIAEERDKLRDLLSDAEVVADCCDSAIDDLEHAADTLSQYL